MAEFQTATVALSRTFTKSRETVWEALTAGIQNWWPKEFYIGTYDGIAPEGIELDSRVGGLFVERWGGGDGLLWATVITSVTPRHLLLVGDSAPQFGGPNRAFTEFKLSEAGEGCELAFTHSPHGVVSEATAGTLEVGWNTLLDHLVKWVEEGVHPERPPSVTGA